MAPRGAQEVWEDGAFRPTLRAAPALERGLFETLRAADGALFFVERHLARLARGAQRVGLEWPPLQDPRTALGAAAEKIGARRARLRLTYGHDAAGRLRLWLEIGRWPRVLPSPTLWVDGPGSAPDASLSALRGLKTTERAAYDAARARARSHGAWDALLSDSSGRLVEGAVSNLYLALGERLVTPGPSTGALPGILLGVVRDALAAEGAGSALLEGHPGGEDLEQAEEVLVSNALVGVRGAARVLSQAGERAFPGARGPWARRLSALVREWSAREAWRP